MKTDSRIARNRLMDGLLNLLFPSNCPLCRSVSDDRLYNPICTVCWQGIEKYDGPACRICGVMITSRHATICGECLESRPSFSKILYYGIYEDALREAIHLLKFGSIKRLAKPLAVLAAGVCTHNVDVVVPVPISKAGLIKRGFNQTAELGKHIASLLDIDLIPDALIKTVETPPQTEVSGRDRLTNVRGAFSSSNKTAGMRVLLVDDVITTGATVRECSKVLVKAGAASVTVVAPARSIRRF